ncbi:MAG TPA: iron-containing alcohol dehydrogenase [Nevskiales bacterium]|nr:iron-containing alcohol dehydrogenase [Nevskiales bacterium]
MNSPADDKRRLLHVPARFDIYSSLDETCVALSKAIERHCARDPRAVLFSGDSHTADAARIVASELSKTGLNCYQHRVSDSTLAEVREAVSSLRGNADILVAVGGGSVIDVAKLAAHELGQPLIIIPTALSSDCIGSPVAVIKDDNGHRQSLPSVIPNQVLVDTSITLTAPQEMALAGVCDVLSNASAVLDAGEAQQQVGYVPDNFSITLSESAYRLVLPVNWDYFNTAAGHRVLCKSLILSGLAMGFSGDSVPCSGAEHAISHALDRLNPRRRLHGLQVGMTTRYCHHLRRLLNKKELPSAVVQALDSLDLLTPEAMGITQDVFLRAVRLGTAIRPGRYTVLNQLPEEPALLEEAYRLAFT